MSTKLLTAAQVGKDELHNFLSRFFPAAKSLFLYQNGAWLHGGEENRWVLTINEKIVGYCAVIPTTVDIENKPMPALWWVDIIIDPQFRGQRLQSHFDEQIKQTNRVKLGFPNQLAAQIHRKHHWGVREDLQVRLIPLRPLLVNQVHHAKGWRGTLLKIGAVVLSPVTALFRLWLRTYRPNSARRVTSPSVEQFTSVYQQYPPVDFATTHRDPSYFTQRFLNSPYLEQLSYYLCGPVDSPSHYLVTRTFKRDGVLVTRILDLYGNFTNQQRLRDLLLCVLKDSAKLGVSQVTVMTTLSELTAVLKKSGFLFSSIARFCWLSEDSHIMTHLGEKIHWTLADSDNDEIS